MIAVRTLLGFFESVITPALIMITSAWYQRNEAAPRFGLWYCGMGIGQIFGGLVSFAAQHSHSSFHGWRIMFLTIGIVNGFVAAVIFFWLPATPEEANFLNSAEKEAIAQRLHDDHAGLGVKRLRVRSILETFLDLQTWLLCLLTILNVIPSGVITTYSSILIKGFGYTNKQAALLNMPSGLVTIFALLSSTYAVRKGYQRWFSIILMVIPTLIGACLMSFLPKSNKAGLLTGIYLVNFVSSILSVKWLSTNKGGRLWHRMPWSSLLLVLISEGTRVRLLALPSSPWRFRWPISSDPKPFRQRMRRSTSALLPFIRSSDSSRFKIKH
jgi:MFS family permease